MTARARGIEQTLSSVRVVEMNSLQMRTAAWDTGKLFLPSKLSMSQAALT